VGVKHPLCGPAHNVLAIILWAWWPDRTAVGHVGEAYAKALLTAGLKMAEAEPGDKVAGVSQVFSPGFLPLLSFFCDPAGARRVFRGCASSSALTFAEALHVSFLSPRCSRDA
jgi:hypothetical protein